MGLSQQSESPPPQNLLAPGKLAQRFWQALHRWFRVNTFAPAWLGKRWGHPLIGIGAAILSQVIVLSLRQVLVQAFPQAVFYSALSLLSVAIIALSWGAGPSVISTLLGAFLLDIFILPHVFSIALDSGSAVLSILIYLLAGFAISTLASQTERARRSAQTLAATLEQERARLETILEAMPDAVTLYDAQGRLLWLNRKGRQNINSAHTPRTLEEMPAFYAMRTPSGDPLTLEQLPLMRALRGETIEGLEVLYREGQGQDRLIAVSVAPLRDAQGRVAHVVSISRDISDLRQAESEAAKRADELEGIFAAIGDGIIIFDAEGRILHMNPAGEHILSRINPPDQVALPLAERIESVGGLRDEQGVPLAQADWPHFRILRGELLTHANAPDIRERLRDGSEIQLNVSGAPIRDQTGKVVRIICVYRDVAERRQLERRTQEALESLLLMAEALVAGPIASPADVPGKLPTTNEAAQRLVELTRRVLGCKRVSIVAIEPDTELQLPVATVGLNPAEEAFWWNEQAKIPFSAGPDPTLALRLRAGEIIIIDMTRPPFQGQPNPYNIQTVLAAPIRIGERLVGVLGLDYGNEAHAFTTQEIALTGAVSQLGALVLERERLTRERTEAQGRVVALEEASGQINRFLSLVSHELRTPVTTLKIGIQLMLKHLEGTAADEQASPDQLLSLFQQQERGLRRTDKQIRRLTHLLDDLIDLSRIRLGKLDIHAERCDLEALVRETVEVERLNHPERSVTLVLPPDASVQVQAEPDRIGQVLTNYLTNALKYSPAAQPVEVGLEVQGQHAQVWVRDQGPGIPPEEQQRIWELFHRVPGIEVKNGSGIGLGLGLYLSKMMIEQHRGEVGVESRTGQGSTFWFTLPLDALDAPADTGG